VRNGEKYLEDAIQSVLRQDYALEYIIVDGASTDGTLDIISDYQDKIDYWISEPDKGIYDAMNKGISFARGRYIKLLNADDMLAESAVKDYLLKIDEPPPHIICGSVAWIDHNNRVLGVTKPKIDGPNDTAFLHPSWYVHRSVYETIGLYDVNFRISGDYEYFHRARIRGIEFSDFGSTLSLFRVGGLSTGIKAAIEDYRVDQMYKGRFRALALLMGRFAGKSRFLALRILLRNEKANRLRSAFRTRYPY
jgi:glycosyltransferase involved in cell wall biosynthesis